MPVLHESEPTQECNGWLIVYRRHSYHFLNIGLFYHVLQECLSRFKGEALPAVSRQESKTDIRMGQLFSFTQAAYADDVVIFISPSPIY